MLKKAGATKAPSPRTDNPFYRKCNCLNFATVTIPNFWRHFRFSCQDDAAGAAASSLANASIPPPIPSTRYNSREKIFYGFSLRELEIGRIIQPGVGPISPSPCCLPVARTLGSVSITTGCFIHSKMGEANDYPQRLPIAKTQTDSGVTVNDTLESSTLSPGILFDRSHRDISSLLRWLWLNTAIGGSRSGASLAASASGTLSVLTFSALVYAISSFVSDGKADELSLGECRQIGRCSTLIHGSINVRGSSLLSASSSDMQSLCAPK
ncbi:hypothetical protein BDV96DRAFT_603415 [Lophiotrema nucula]|uniref:DUF6536 domain-containing protein n=1 Tax=Lophiotrema nucula TaxID=690887 RepID=A0A6A5YVQ6_9PLEO|nr:hypothetical protein BDV96DRAFT_603415 [Lophiotrema nucula]